MKIYVALSWRNQRHPLVVLALRKDGHYVYDFTDRNQTPDDGVTPPTFAFNWGWIDPAWKQWSTEEYQKALEHELAMKGFESDFSAMKWADSCVLVLPCNRSAHLELGWFLGQGKPGYILLDKESFEPELMYKLATGVYADLGSLRVAIAGGRTLFPR